MRNFVRAGSSARHGESLALPFCLVSSLFLLWGFCNGLIDVMDKHFQDELHLTKAQSAWVQTAHYLGYALMALPAGLLARVIGYKGGSHGTSHCVSGRLLVHCRDRDLLLLGLSPGCQCDRHGAHGTRDRGQPVHHRAGSEGIRAVPHQPRAEFEWHRLDAWPARRRRVLLFLSWHRRFSQPASAAVCGRRRSSSLSWRWSFIAVASRISCLPKTPSWPRAAPRINLAAAAFFRRRRRPVPLRRRSGRHLQLLHQLHGLGDSSTAGELGERRLEEWIELARWLAFAQRAGCRATSGSARIRSVSAGRLTGTALLTRTSAPRLLGSLQPDQHCICARSSS